MNRKGESNTGGLNEAASLRQKALTKKSFDIKQEGKGRRGVWRNR